MNKLRILSVKSIPRFIGEYFNKNLISFDDIKEFSKILISTEFDYIEYSNNQYIGFLDYTPKLIKFYKDKSKLDHYYRCKYEDELDIPKSISNEVYVLQLIDESIISVSLLYNFDCNILVLNVE